MGYVDSEYYITHYNHLTELDEDTIQILLDEAANDIDILTFGRIRKFGYDNFFKHANSKIKASKFFNILLRTFNR